MDDNICDADVQEVEEKLAGESASEATDKYSKQIKKYETEYVQQEIQVNKK